MRTVNSKPVNPYPNLAAKETLQLSASTTLRRREPTNPHTASKARNYVFDHSEQMALLPGGRTMNRSGHPYALGTLVGGAPNQRGTTLSSRSPAAKLTK